MPRQERDGGIRRKSVYLVPFVGREAREAREAKETREAREAREAWVAWETRKGTSDV